MTTTTHRGSQEGLLKNEPVTIGGAVLGFGNAVLGALPLFGVDITAEQVGAANLVFVALVALVTAIQRHYATPNVKVVERKEGEKVIAGEANEVVPTGDVIRKIGEPLTQDQLVDPVDHQGPYDEPM